MRLAVELSNRAKQVLELQRLELQVSKAQDNPTKLPERARAAALAALERGETHYTDRPGILPLRERVADWLEHHYGVRVNPKTSIVITCGDTEARFVALQQLLGSGDALLCLGDAPLVKAALVIREAELVDAKTEVEPEKLESVKGIYLSATAPPDLRDKWLEEAEARGWWLIYDVTEDPDCNAHPATDAALSARTVTIGGVGYAQGLESWRVGFFGRARRGSP